MSKGVNKRNLNSVSVSPEVNQAKNHQGGCPQRTKAIALHLFPVSDVHTAARFVFLKVRLFNVTYAGYGLMLNVRVFLLNYMIN